MKKWTIILFALIGPILATPPYESIEGSTHPKTLKRGTSGFALAKHQTPPKYERRERDTLGILFPGQCHNDPQCSFEDKMYRTSDGSCNNIDNPSFGRSGLPYLRLIPANDKLQRCGGNLNLPNPREVSSLTIKRGEKGLVNDLSIMLMTWGQIVDHDIELTPPRQTADEEFLDCCDDENLNSQDCCPLFAPSQDPFYGREGRPRCIPFLRSKLVEPSGCTGSRRPDVVNANTPWLDGSFVYGSDEERVKLLRSFENGMLETSVDRRKRLFPKVTNEDGFKMEFGDTRGDVHPGVTMLTTVFLRNHNFLAESLKQLHLDWDDDKLYQEARKINSAIVQHITYREFIDLLLGTPNNVGISEFRGRHTDFYDSSQNGAIAMGFGTAAYRLHTFVSGFFELRDANFLQHHKLQLRDIFHNPLVTMANDTYDDVMRGMCGQALHGFDNEFTTEMTEWLFRENKENFGMDIAALNIQRGRDHKLPGYAVYKEFCGLGKTTTWQHFTDLIPGDLVHRLVHVYKRPEDVDLYVAGNMEVPVAGSILGPTFHCLVREQFERLRNADRFFYTNPGQFSNSQLSAINQVTFASVLCQNADNQRDMRLPRNVFKMVSSRNPLFHCNQHPRLNLQAWR